MNQEEQNDQKQTRDEVSPSIRDFIINFRKQQAQQARQQAYQQTQKKTIPIKQITQLKSNRQSIDTQTENTEIYTDSSFKRNSIPNSFRQNSTYTQSSYTTREAQVQSETTQTKQIDLEQVPSARINFHYLNQHYQSSLSQQSEQTSQNISQQLPFVYKSPQKHNGNLDFDQMTEQILNKVIQELDRRNSSEVKQEVKPEVKQEVKPEVKQQQPSQKQPNLQISNQTVCLSVIPQPNKDEEDDSFLRFIQMSLIKNRWIPEEQENVPPPVKSAQKYCPNIPKLRQQNSRSSINKSLFQDSKNNTLRETSKSNAHLRLYQDACMRQERKTMAANKKNRY